MSRILRLGALLLTLTSCAGTETALAPDPAAGSTALAVDTREERIAVDPDTLVFRLRNPHGDVRLRVTDQPAVGIHATIQRIGETPLDATFDIRQRDGLFELTIRYPDEAALLARGDHGYGRVDLGVWVPSRLALDLATSSGLLQVRGASSEVLARTTSGDLEVASSSGLDLASVSGNIAFSQNSGQWSEPVRVHTVTGQIYASVPMFADIELSVVAGGRIEVAPGLPQPTTRQDGGMSLDARFGTALRRLQIESGSGDVYLYRVIPESEMKPSGPGTEPEPASR